MVVNIRRVTLQGLGILFLSASFAHAVPPKVETEPLEFAIPKPERVLLSNGVAVYLLEDHELPLVNLQLRIPISPADEPADRPGSLGFMGELWRSGGTVKRTPEELNRALEHMASSVETGAGAEAMSVSVSFLTKNRAATLEIFKDVLLHPAFREDQFALIKARLAESHRRRNDTPDGIGRRLFRDVMYGREHLYARDITPEDARKTKRSDLAKLHKKLIHPDRALLAVSGDFDKKEMLAALETLFSDWKPTGRVVPEYDYEIHERPQGEIFLAPKDFNQSRVSLGSIGIRRHHPDTFPLLIADFILGGGGPSRLFGTIRSRLGLAYAVGSFVTDPKGPGMVGAVSLTKAEATAAVIRALRTELSRFAEGPILANEIRLAKDAIVNSYVFRFGSHGQIVIEWLDLELYDYPADYLLTYPDKIANVSAEDVARVAKTYFSPEGMRVVVVGDPSKFDAPLDTLGPVTTVPIETIP